MQPGLEWVAFNLGRSRPGPRGASPGNVRADAVMESRRRSQRAQSCGPALTSVPGEAGKSTLGEAGPGPHFTDNGNRAGLGCSR